jgi:pyridoxal phosphate enzyme (YggS family)
MAASNVSERLAENVRRVKERIALAAERSGRDPAEVRLVAVTKYIDRDVAERLPAAGCLDLGESRPQRLWELAESWRGPPVRWHLVGRLQRNKVARTATLVSMIHSVDSERLLDAINMAASKLDRPIDVPLEVHLSGEASKQGFTPSEAADIASRAANWPNVQIRGLMTMAPLEGGLDAARSVFRSLRELRDVIQGQSKGASTISELSMGMSGDFETAVEEGATIVRVGSALFEGVVD